MENKLSELKAAAMAATPGPWFRSSVQFNGITTEETFITQGNKPHVAGASEKRDAIFIAVANPVAVLALLAELEAKDKRIAELEQRLATPVRLKKVDSSNVPFAGDGFNAAVDYCADAVRAAGFTVEGDDQ
ncbi:ead/Ea22-like family protein [Serratia sp. CY56464]|uniref:ead/Ea22-like family protein n=1 Tax=Serratia sp. CY56464 TaxID=3383641 RepID=UPI003F9ED3B3